MTCINFNEKHQEMVKNGLHYDRYIEIERDRAQYYTYNHFENHFYFLELKIYNLSSILYL